MVALPGQLFYSTQIPVCLWFLARDKGARTASSAERRARSDAPYHDRRGRFLFLDARKMGRMIDRVQRDLTPEDIAKIVGTYHAWREFGVPALAGKGRLKAGLRTYEDIAGFCKSATLEDIRAHGHVLTPGRYVGAADIEDDGEPFEQKMKRLTATLEEQFTESAKVAKRFAQI